MGSEQGSTARIKTFISLKKTIDRIREPYSDTNEINLTCKVVYKKGSPIIPIPGRINPIPCSNAYSCKTHSNNFLPEG